MTERAKSHANIIEDAADRWLAAIVQSSEDAVIGKSLDGIVLSWNAGAERLYGYSADEMVGRPISVIVPPETPDEVPSILHKIRQGQRVEHYRTRRLRKDGSVVIVSLTISPVRTEDEEIIGASVIARDITRQEEAEAAQREFIAIAAHDLRTPTTVITGMSQMLHSRWETLETSDKLQMVESIERQSLQLTRLVNDLLMLSRLDAGAVETQPEVVGLRELIAGVVGELGNPVGVAVDVPAAARAFADPDHVRRIVRNYLSNALAYGTPPIDVTVRSSDGDVEVRVRDHGEGVPAEFVPRLFSRFARARTAGPTHAGTGLGLSIVQGLARAAGGDAWYERADGGGSVFAARLPQPASPPPGDDPSVKLRVLVVVEDDPDMRLLIRLDLAAEASLDLLGEACTAEEAIELAASARPDLIVLDHGLGGVMTGLEAAPLLRQRAPEAKILLFSAFDLDEEARAEPAIDAFVRKDRRAELLPMVRRLLGIA